MDRAAVEEGKAIVHWCLQRNRPSPYQLQAAINAVHTDARSADDTQWPQIVALYDHLLAPAPTRVVALHRAVAVGEVDGPLAALRLVDQLDLDQYYPFHATRADLAGVSVGIPRRPPPTHAPLPWRPRKPNVISSRAADAVRLETKASPRSFRL